MSALSPSRHAGLVPASAVPTNQELAKALPPAPWTPAQGRGDEDGFSLIEALVALSVLAIATVGLMRTVEAHIDSTRGMERRSAAMWVAENRLAELEAGIPPHGEQVDMLGQAWTVRVTRQGTDDPEIARVKITVTPVGESAPLASLDGFVDGERR